MNKSLEQQDSNLRMMESKSIALPLGHVPFNHTNRSDKLLRILPNNGIEPLTKRFSVFCSTTELVRQNNQMSNKTNFKENCLE